MVTDGKISCAVSPPASSYRGAHQSQLFTETLGRTYVINMCVCVTGAASQHYFYINIVDVARRGDANCQLLCKIQSKSNGAFEGT